MRYLAQWKDLLGNDRLEMEAEDIIDRIEKKFQRLAPIAPQSIRLPIKTDILPLLALYQALSEDRTRNREDVLYEVEFLYNQVYARSLRNGIRMLSLWPNPFALIRRTLVQMSRDSYAPGDAEIIEDSPNCFAINGKRCYILEELTRRGASELTRVFCKTDDWLSASLPAVRFTRTQTIATGGSVCDFRWERVRLAE